MKSLYFENNLARVVALKIASRIDRYAALGPLSTLRRAEVPEPEIPNARWLKVRNRACGLCGTDLHFMFMELAPKGYAAALPGVAVKDLGHELVGEVVEARIGLVRKGLVAYRYPLFQVLDFPRGDR